MINSQIPKTIAAWIFNNADKIEEYWMEEDEFNGSRSPWSIWLHLKPGLIAADTETHFIHESTAKAFLIAALNIEPCNCDECQQLQARGE